MAQIDPKCIKCDVALTDSNWPLFYRVDGTAPHNTFKCKDCYKSIQRNIRSRKRQLVLDAYGNKCACCGYDHQPGLDIDHIYNDGHIERRERGDIILRLIKEGFPKDRYQLLCKNCNKNKMMTKSVTCNCKEEISNELQIKSYIRPKKYLNIKFAPKENLKCTDCLTSLNDENYTWNKTQQTRKKLCNECSKERQREGIKKRRQQVLNAYGNKCSCCHYSKPLLLEIDHVHNNGAQERKEHKIKCFYRHAITLNFPPDYQLLCANCNFLKGKKNPSCPCPHRKP